MTLTVLADIHANFVALQTVTAHIPATIPFQQSLTAPVYRASYEQAI